MRILHVSECMSGGTATAVIGYAKGLDTQEHFLLANARRAHGGMIKIPQGIFSAIRELPTGHVEATMAVVKAAKEFSPDLIHAHSSFGGAYARLATLVPGMPKVPIVYTPHGLSFSRGDISTWKKLVFKGMETLLAPLTDVFAGCSTNESTQLKALWPWGKHVCVPNAIPDEKKVSLKQRESPSQRKIAVLGRISPARNPELFASIAKLVQADPDLRDVTVAWIGDGPEELRSKLIEAGVQVTGWIDPAQVVEELGSLSVLVHTARWDGFPMAVLEARALGVPTIVSDIPALFECPRDARFASAEGAVSAIKKLLASPEAFDWSEVEGFYNQTTQIEKLKVAYGLHTTGDQQ